MKNNVFVFDHPLIKHKIALLRDKNCDSKTFRELIEEITALMVYESMRDIPLIKRQVETPLEVTEQQKIENGCVVAVPILRAGLGMLDGIYRALPTVGVGHIGLARDEKTLKAKEYLCKLPDGIESKRVILLDPMIATGGSSVSAIDSLKARGCKDISFMAIIGAPEGVEKVIRVHPDVKIYLAALDRRLNENGYVLPGLGDAGDRIFSTK